MRRAPLSSNERTLTDAFKTMKLDIISEIGPRCIVAGDGQKIHDLVLDSLKSGEDVWLDFTNVRQFASPFFNFSIGQLLTDVSEELLRSRLHLENLNEVGKIVVERVILNASQFRKNTDHKKIVDDLLKAQAQGSIDGH
jgi:STAS-like domain of unknown function (DUF4325)